MGRRKGPILPFALANGRYKSPEKTGKCNCRQQGALIVAGGAFRLCTACEVQWAKQVGRTILASECLVRNFVDRA